MSSNIITSIRVRPFSNKELVNKNTNVVSMNGNETKIQNKDKSHTFNFDNSFWSHDGYKINNSGYTEAVTEKYTDQKRLFESLGQPLLDNAWRGYNCSLFAYGQTGSGKTYSIMGYKENKGLVPMICEGLFQKINEKAPKLKEGEKYQVTMGMVEIYNEKLRDLLSPKNSENLLVKEEVGRGFFAPNQIMATVSSCEGILQKIESGNKLRTIASTNMNETSSRAHTIVSLQFIQILVDENKKMARKTSIINLIDLAGSEQVKKSLAEGERMKEAQSINKSLHTLGLCLYNLSTKQSHVPYRDSMLTKLLMNALGGNSKTVLLAAISPADTNFEETLSTLYFAERVKTVVTTAKINITANDEAVRKLAEENLKLQKMLKELQEKKKTQSDSELIQELQNQIMRNKEDAETAAMSWKEQVQQAKDELEKKRKADQEKQQKLKATPHMFNLNDDPALNKMLVYVFEKPVTVIGNSKTQHSSSEKDNIDIDLQGINIEGKHAEIRHDKASAKTFIKPIANANLFINGNKITAECELRHYDRILLGNSLYFFHYDPLSKLSAEKNVNEPTIDVARQEMTEKMDEFKGLASDDKRLAEELSTVFPLVQEANVMATQLNKKVNYSLVIFHKGLPGFNETLQSQIKIRVFLTQKKWEYFLDVSDFTDIRFGMLDMYHDFENGITTNNDKNDTDPFIPRDSDICYVGFTFVLLSSIKYLLEFSDQLPITNFRAKEIGSMKFNCIPCDSTWAPIDFSENEIPNGSILFLKIFVDQIRLDQTVFKQVYYRLKFFDRIIRSPMASVVNDVAEFKFEYKVDGMRLDDSIRQFLGTMVGIEIWGSYGLSECGNKSNETASKDSQSIVKLPDNPIGHESDVTIAATKRFMEEFTRMAEKRVKEGHSTIELSDLKAIVPQELAPSSAGWASKICVIQ